MNATAVRTATPKAGRTLTVVSKPTAWAPGVIEIKENGILDRYTVEMVPGDGPAVVLTWTKTFTTSKRSGDMNAYRCTVEPSEGYTACTCPGAKYAKTFTDKGGEIRYVPCRHAAASLMLLAIGSI